MTKHILIVTLACAIAGLIYVTGWFFIPILTPNTDGNHGELYVPVKMLVIPFYCFSIIIIGYLVFAICNRSKNKGNGK